MKVDLMLDSAVSFLINSIFASLGALVVVATIILINNMIKRYWKPLGWFRHFDNYYIIDQPQQDLQKPEPKVKSER